MARIAITGAADGLGKLTAEALQADGHDVLVHVRSRTRASAVSQLLDRGATLLVGDLSVRDEVLDVATQLRDAGVLDAVIHNAGVYSGRAVMPVNVIAPYLLTALVPAPARLIYVSSNMHRSGRAALARVDWRGARADGSYSDSKLFVTVFAAAVARRWPAVRSHAVDPGWVPTKMGGAGAPDDLTLGHRTQEWLAVSHDDAARTTGGYWHHRRRAVPHDAVHDEAFQEQLLSALAVETGVVLP